MISVRAFQRQLESLGIQLRDDVAGLHQCPFR